MSREAVALLCEFARLAGLTRAEDVREYVSVWMPSVTDEDIEQATEKGEARCHSTTRSRTTR